MNFKHILSEIEKSDPEVYEKISGRRDVLKNFGSKVAIAALPFAIGSLFKTAYGQSTKPIVDALNKALELEYLQYNFYHIGNNTGNLIPPASGNSNNDQPGFATIEAQELAHINFLKATIKSMAAVPFTPPGYNASALNPNYVPTAYNFTATGTEYASTFVDVFANYDTFLVAAQIIEDTCIHFYQGQMPTWVTNVPILKQMMQLQAAEARQAAHVRLLRRLPPMNATDLPAPWISANIPPRIALQKYYNTEDNVGQMSVDVSRFTIPGGTETIQRRSASAAFDEAYDLNLINSLMAPFKK